MAHLARSCPNLQTLDLNDCVRLTDETCAAIARHCATLTHLNLSGLRITNASLEALSASSILTSKLRHLDLSFCLGLTAAGLIALLTPSPQAVQSAAGHTVALANSTCFTDRLKTESAVQPLRNLTVFAAKMDVHLATNESIALLAAAAALSLRTLVLSKCSNLTGNPIPSLLPSCCPLLTAARYTDR